MSSKIGLIRPSRFGRASPLAPDAPILPQQLSAVLQGQIYYLQSEAELESQSLFKSLLVSFLRLAQFLEHPKQFLSSPGWFGGTLSMAQSSEDTLNTVNAVRQLRVNSYLSFFNL